MAWIALVPIAAAAGSLAGWAGRLRHEQGVDQLWQQLALDCRHAAPAFDPAMVAGLPPPARRFLLRAIAPGTPLATGVLVRMRGEMRLRPGGTLLPMRARELLVPPRGMIWRADVGSGLVRFRGFDMIDAASGRGAMRWWLHGVLPIVRAENPAVARSAAGRLAGEAVLVPSTLLPGRGAEWQPVDDSTVAFTLRVGDQTVTSTVVVDPDGRLVRVTIDRWREDGANGRPGYSRFVVDEWSDERTFDGYTIPTRFRAGWQLREPGGFPFFYARLDEALYR